MLATAMRSAWWENGAGGAVFLGWRACIHIYIYVCVCVFSCMPALLASKQHIYIYIYIFTSQLHASIAGEQDIYIYIHIDIFKYGCTNIYIYICSEINWCLNLNNFVCGLWQLSTDRILHSLVYLKSLYIHTCTCFHLITMGGIWNVCCFNANTSWEGLHLWQ